MPPRNRFSSAHCFTLRRDFADELGFGEYFSTTPRGQTTNRRRAQLNRGLGLSPSLPRYLGYFTHNGEGYVTPDGELAYGAPVDGLFQELLSRLAVGVQRNPTFSGSKVRSGKDLDIEADWDGTPRHLVVHDAYTSRAWLVPACDEAFDILREQK
ncbi:MAG TPA: hypothetical protein VGL42_16700 [Opitutaceae bacterium]|jgi:hypothetical protein